MKKMCLGVVLLGSVVSGVAQASLATVTENPLVLSDNVTGLMWTQDANLAATNSFGVSGIGSDGRMNWATAKTWVTAMNAANYGGYSDWRLPTVSAQNGSSFNYNWASNGTTDIGYNVSGQASELGYMYYQNLGAKGEYDTSGNYQSGYGVQGVGTNDGTGYDVGAVENVEPYAYWSGTADELGSGDAWIFVTGYGYQDAIGQNYLLYAWAVRSGDVAAAEVGEPAGVTLAFLGFGLVALRKRRWGFGASSASVLWGCRGR